MFKRIRRFSPFISLIKRNFLKFTLYNILYQIFRFSQNLWIFHWSFRLWVFNQQTENGVWERPWVEGVPAGVEIDAGRRKRRRLGESAPRAEKFGASPRNATSCRPGLDCFFCGNSRARGLSEPPTPAHPVSSPETRGWQIGCWLWCRPLFTRRIPAHATYMYVSTRVCVRERLAMGCQRSSSPIVILSISGTAQVHLRTQQKSHDALLDQTVTCQLPIYWCNLSSKIADSFYFLDCDNSYKIRVWLEFYILYE